MKLPHLPASAAERASGSESQRSFVLTAPLGFVSLALLWCQVGYLTPTVSRAFGGFLWLLVVFLAADKKRWLWLILSALLLFNPYGAVHRPEGLWLLGLLPWAGGIWGRRWMGAAWIAAVCGWIWVNFPGLWVPLDEFAATTAVGFSKANLSSGAAGLPLLALALAFPLAATLSERRFLAPLATIIGLMVTVLLSWWLQRPLEIWLHRLGVHGIFDAFNLQWVLLILIGLVLTIWAVFDPPRLARSSRRSVWAIPILALIGALLAGWPSSVGQPTLGKQILFYNKGYLNWDVPMYGTYGRSSGGMFGLIPDYLRWRGFQVARCDSLTAEALGDAGAVVMINLQDPLTDPEESAVRQFVDKGGSLLLLGDHTGLGNIREPSNHLLKPYGIELNFDSAKPTRTGWAGSLVCALHSLTAGLDLERQGGDSPGVTQIWVGASLKVSAPGLPLIVGREGFSDVGNEANVKDGYLGDFRYRTDERLGNLVLLAEAKSGRGKVLVFGDTSTLQNGALVRAGGFVQRLFAYLLAPATMPSETMKIAGVLLLIGGIAVWALSGAGAGGLLLGVLALSLGAGFCQHRTASFHKHLDFTWNEEAHPRALLDYSHSPRVPLNLTGGDGTWGLQNCLMRSGFLPQAMEPWDKVTLADAQLLLEIAPVKKFSRAERKEIQQFMQKGGLVVLSCGMEEYDGSRSLLREYGLEPIYVPLGPAALDSTRILLPAEGDTLGMETEAIVPVQFHEAWQIRSTNPTIEVLLAMKDTTQVQGGERPIAAFVPVGNGGLLYLADTDFLTNRNLESPTGEYYEGNVLYLRHILRRFAGGI